MLTTATARINDRSMAAPIFTRPRWLPASKINGAQIDHTIISDGCIISHSDFHQSIVGVRSIIAAGSRLERTVVLGNDFYETDASIAEHQANGQPRIGIGRNTSIDNAIIDKNARIGDDVSISPAGKPPHVDHALYYIREGIVIIPKNGVVPHGTRI